VTSEHSRAKAGWATLTLVCLAQFMVILDVSIVNVALPSIRGDLDFSQVNLQWVVNAYTITFAGFLLLGGRACDVLGRRRVFIGGLLLFAGASLVGGLSQSQGMLIGARAAQGLGGAVVSPATLAILTTTFTEGAERNRALGVWGAMGGAGGAAGALLGGILTDLLSWQWILFVNVPIGVIVALLTPRFVEEGKNPHAGRNFDLAGALTVTVGLVALVFGIVRTEEHGWGAAATLVPMLIGVALIAVFIAIEARFAKHPLIPLRIFRSRTLSGANLTVFLLGSAMFGMWYFVSLYLQQVLGYSPIEAGLAFLPMTVTIIVGSTLSSRLVARIGAKPLLVGGMATLAVGLLLFTGVSVGGSYFGDIFLPSLVTAAGLGAAFVPVTIAAVAGVQRSEAGLASGLVNTSRQMGGALGLAILATVAATTTRDELRDATRPAVALTDGFHHAFLLGAAFALAGALVALFVLPRIRPPRQPAPVAEPTPQES
jgi:EmrB/QacA subfamily drug resistance transporter